MWPANAARRRFVDAGPKQPELFDGAGKLEETDRLDHVSVDTQPVAALQIPFFTRRSEHDDRDGSQSLVLLDHAQHFKTADLGHLNIEENDGRIFRRALPVLAAAEKKIERLVAVADDHDMV